MAEHTPIPWMAEDYVVLGSDRRIVCGATNEDAALIVKAVNHHEEMVKALRDMEPLYAQAATHWTGDPELIDIQTEMMKRTRALLAKIDGGA